MKNLVILGTMLSLTLTVSCGKSKKKKTSAPPPPSDNTSELLGDEVIAIVGERCVSCHNSTDKEGGLDFTDISVILYNAEDIVRSINDGSMPADGTDLSEEEEAIMNAWQEDGYPAPSPATKVKLPDLSGDDGHDGDHGDDDDHGDDWDNHNGGGDWGDGSDKGDYCDGKGKGKGDWYLELLKKWGLCGGHDDGKDDDYDNPEDDFDEGKK